MKKEVADEILSEAHNSGIVADIFETFDTYKGTDYLIVYDRLTTEREDAARAYIKMFCVSLSRQNS